MTSLLGMFSAPPAEGHARPLAPSKPAKHAASNRAGSSAPPTGRRMQKTYEPAPPTPPTVEPEYEEEEEEVEPEDEGQPVDADRRIHDMNSRKEEYTKVYNAQIALLNELSLAIGPTSTETTAGDQQQQQQQQQSYSNPQQDEHINQERVKIENQRIAIRQQYVRLMLQCTALTSDYGKFSPAPLLPEQGPKGLRASPQTPVRVQPYTYQQQKPAAAQAYAPSVSQPKVPAPAYVPSAPAPVDLTQFEPHPSALSGSVYNNSVITKPMSL